MEPQKISPIRPTKNREVLTIKDTDLNRDRDKNGRQKEVNSIEVVGKFFSKQGMFREIVDWCT